MDSSIRGDLVRIARNLAERLKGTAEESDRSGIFSQKNFSELKKSGLMLMALPTDYGGKDASMLEISEVLKEISFECPSTALIFNMHLAATSQFAHMSRGSSDEKWKKLLKRVSKERLFVGGALSEYNSWNAVMFPNAIAQKVGDGFIINGERSFCTGGKYLDLVQGTAKYKNNKGIERTLYFVVDTNSKGIEFHNNWDALGMRTSESGGVSFNNVFISNSDIYYEFDSNGLDFSQEWLSFLSTSFIGFGSVYLGIALKAKDIVFPVVINKKRIPREEKATLAHKPTNQIHAAKIQLLNTTSETILVGMARKYPIDAPASLQMVIDTAIAKQVSINNAVESVGHCVSMLGGQSYSRKFPLERLWRDVQAGPFHPFSIDDSLELFGKLALGVPLLEPTPWIM